MFWMAIVLVLILAATIVAAILMFGKPAGVPSPVAKKRPPVVLPSPEVEELQARLDGAIKSNNSMIEAFDSAREAYVNHIYDLEKALIEITGRAGLTEVALTKASVLAALDGYRLVLVDDGEEIITIRTTEFEELIKLAAESELVTVAEVSLDDDEPLAKSTPPPLPSNDDEPVDLESIHSQFDEIDPPSEASTRRAAPQSEFKIPVPSRLSPPRR